MESNCSDALGFISWQGARSAEPEHMWVYVRIRASQQRRLPVRVRTQTGHGTKDRAGE